jgi:hypothetical protein
LPAAEEFQVSAAGNPVGVKRVGFKRRVLYAPLKKRDLRIANCLYLQLSTPVTNGQVLEVTRKTKPIGPATARFTATADPLRYSPSLHINQVGYVPGMSKKGMVGYFLGSLGELDLKDFGVNDSGVPLKFKLLDTQSGKEMFTGSLLPRKDAGFPSPAYEHVLEADFSDF